MSAVGKTTFDPDAWAAALLKEIETRSQIYEVEPDFALKRNKAANIIGCIAGHLQEHPAFAKSDCLLPVKDALIFFHSLEEGSGHPWAKATNVGGTNSETAAETEVRTWIVVGVWLLTAGGYGQTAAYRFMADVMTKRGRRSQKTDGTGHAIEQPFSFRNVQRWWLAYSDGSDKRLRKVDQHIAHYWARAVCPHGNTMLNCPTRPDGRCSEWLPIAEDFASRALLEANFRDWFIST